MISSLLLQVFRQTFARSLLLVVCLGYGIVRPKLMFAEWVSILVVSILYFVCAIISQVSDIVLVQENAHSITMAVSDDLLLAYKVPELFLDVIFLTWIYLAISSTIRILTEFQQTAKLQMYQRLVTIIGVFAVLFMIVTVLFLLSKCIFLHTILLRYVLYSYFH